MLSRTFKEIEVEGKGAYVLFDTGSMRSYVREEIASEVRRKIDPFTVGLGVAPSKLMKYVYWTVQ